MRSIRHCREICNTRKYIGLDCAYCEVRDDCVKHMDKYKTIPGNCSDDHIRVMDTISKNRKRRNKK